jgi:hypothetical protein
MQLLFGLPNRLTGIRRMSFGRHQHASVFRLVSAVAAWRRIRGWVIGNKSPDRTRMGSNLTNETSPRPILPVEAVRLACTMLIARAWISLCSV